jgi:thiol-disulfide isomerase/thioredoxin
LEGSKIVRIESILRVFLVAATAITLALPVTASAITRKGDPAPPLKVVSMTGQKITLANYKGHVLILDFFATWCAPCRSSIPHLIGLYRKYNKQGLEILGMSADEDGEKDVREFMGEQKIIYPVALAGDEMLTEYGIRSLPTVYVINKKGGVAEKYMGFNEDMARSMETLIRKLLAE